MKFNESKFNQHWQNKELKDLGVFQRGKSKHRPRNDPSIFEGGTYPLIQTGEVKAANLIITKHNSTYNDIGLKQSKLWPKSTLCITIAANIAETALLEYPMCFPDSIVGFNAYDNESSEMFMHYVFTYIRRAIQTSTSGSIQDNINIDYLTNLKFKVPLKTYQDKIVELLSSIDKKIDLNTKINSELEAMANLIYDYWFVQFNFPSNLSQNNGKPYKASGGKMVYNEELKREIPDGWGSDLVEHLLAKEARTKKLPKTEYLSEGKIPVIDQSSDYISGYTNDHDTLITTETPRIIFGDHTRILKLINFNFARGADGTQVLLSNNQRVPQHFFYHSLLKIDLSNYGYARHFKFLKQTRTIIPNQVIVNLFEDKVSSFYDKIKHNTFENNKLIDLRDWLLPMLMNGQVTIKDS